MTFFFVFVVWFSVSVGRTENENFWQIFVQQLTNDASFSSSVDECWFYSILINQRFFDVKRKPQNEEKSFKFSFSSFRFFFRIKHFSFRIENWTISDFRIRVRKIWSMLLLFHLDDQKRVNQQQHKTNQGSLTFLLKKRKKNDFLYFFLFSTVKPLYDKSGLLISDQTDRCDCNRLKCPGCFLPCSNCQSSKCGLECRSFEKKTKIFSAFS